MELIWENGTRLDCYDNKPGQHGWCGVCNPNAKSGEEGFCSSADSVNLKVCSSNTVIYSKLTPFPQFLQNLFQQISAGSSIINIIYDCPLRKQLTHLQQRIGVGVINIVSPIANMVIITLLVSCKLLGLIYWMILIV